jgi:YHS domain-containing protein
MSQDWSSILWFLGFGIFFFYMMRMGGCGMHSHSSGEGHGSHSSGHGDMLSSHSMEVKDPVCGQAVNMDISPAATRYEGEMYYFHSKECHDEFWNNPPRYAKNTAA